MNLIYQQWSGVPRASAYAGASAMAEYAARIGAEHQFVVREKPWHDVGPKSVHHDKFLPLWLGTHDQYERVLFADTDIFPVEGLQQDIFEGFDGEVGWCTEPLQPDLRKKATSGICHEQDEKWAAMVRTEWGGLMPRRQDGLLKIYNAGLMLWSRAGLQRARRQFTTARDYVHIVHKRHRLNHAYYGSDQTLMHAMCFSHGLDVRELDNEWNRYVHYETRDGQIVRVIDPRTPDTRMVHIQLRGADDWDQATLHRVANLPQSEWRLPQ